jgi:DNA-binding FadR family transcriptional regulator
MSRIRIKLRYGERARVIREVLEALAASQLIFNRAGEIVQVYPQESGVSAPRRLGSSRRHSRAPSCP